ncbi:MAG TPA: signal peptidase II, partial [Haloplasmataceae bacterium]
VLSYYLGVYGSLNNNTLRTVSIIFLIAGTSGNFFDRLLRGEVVDFIDFRHNLPIFNIADLYLFFGMITLFISEIIY